MRTGVLAAMAAVMIVSGCDRVRDSRVNPFNWFGRSEPAQAVTSKPSDPLAGRLQVAQVVELHLERTTPGAILRAKGLPATQGWYKGELVEVPSDNPGELLFRFVLKNPPTPMPAGTVRSREVTVATFLSESQLEGLRSVTVTGSENARSVARR